MMSSPPNYEYVLPSKELSESIKTPQNDGNSSVKNITNLENYTGSFVKTLQPMLDKPMSQNAKRMNIIQTPIDSQRPSPSKNIGKSNMIDLKEESILKD